MDQAITIEALAEWLLREPPSRGQQVAVAAALGWTTGPSKAGWKVVQPYGVMEGGMVAAPPAATEAAEAWFDPAGRERCMVGRDEKLPAWLTSIDAALSAAAREQRGQVLYHALLKHAAWQLDAGVEDDALDRLPAFVVIAILEGLGTGG